MGRIELISAFASVQEKPFVFVKESKTGKKTYTGLCIDLLDKLKEKMKFRYTIEESPGNVYGAPDVFSGEWSGMVRYLDDNVSSAFPFVIVVIRRCTDYISKSGTRCCRTQEKLSCSGKG